MWKLALTSCERVVGPDCNQSRLGESWSFEWIDVLLLAQKDKAICTCVTKGKAFSCRGHQPAQLAVRAPIVALVTLNVVQHMLAQNPFVAKQQPSFVGLILHPILLEERSRALR
ncbi:hypothetical protein Mapa_014689 [Marchantia paleacea]|nr:hypothetical protein Mapa_014689 [Marchantia paleacea]